MDRRATLAAFFGKKDKAAGQGTTQESRQTGVRTSALTSIFQVTSGLEPYAGPWTYEHAAHLLRRTTYGPTYEQIKGVRDQGLNATISQLFQPLPLPAPPINYYFEEDPNVPVGSTWISAPYSTTVNLAQYRGRSLRAWTLGQVLQEGISVREKMVLFWLNHFGIGNVNDPKFNYNHSNLLRTHAWGNFKQLIKDITISPSMLRFLNGNQNTRIAPNENYARELLELFTIGKGPQVGPGDYTNYTEDDVLQMAKVLTGWRDRGFNTVNPATPIEAIFQANQHDTGQKQLSHRFDNVVINNLGNQEYAHLVDIIFQKEEVARFISRKLYRWFIYYIITEDAEANVIEPMAQSLVANNYELEPVLRTLLSSAHFFDTLNLGPMIKNPIDFIAGALKQFKVTMPADEYVRYNVWWRTSTLLSPMEMDIYNLPSVAGWKAYYQEPLYYRSWITASTLPPRMNFTNTLANNGALYNGFRVVINPLAFVATLETPTEVNAMIDEMVKILFPQPITDGQKVALKEVLLPGLPDYEWSLEYGDYLSNPNDVQLANAVSIKLKSLIQTMMSMPEYYLS